MIPEPIKKLQDELEELQAQNHEAQKALSVNLKKEKNLVNKITAAWEAQNDRILNAVKAIAGE